MSKPFMMSLHVERMIHAPVDRVWRVVTDLDRAPVNLTSVVAVERLDGAGYEVGTRWRETRRMLGTQDTQVLEVAAVALERSTVVVSHSRGVAYRTVFELVSYDQSTLLSVDFSGTGEKMSPGMRLLSILTRPIGLSATRKALRQDLADIEAAALTPAG